MKPMLLLLSILCSISSFAQKDTVRMTIDDARRMDENASVLNNTYLIVYDPKTNHLISESNYLNNKREGMSTVYNNNEKIWWRATYKNGLKDGYYIMYYNNGFIERKETYTAGKVTSGKCFDDTGAEIPYFTEPLTYAERMPTQPSNLNRYLEKELQYPEKARDAKVQGTVVVKFVVMQDGTITNPIIARSLSKECDEEAIRLVKGMPKWKPGSQDGKDVNVYFTIPVRFKM